MDYKSVENRLTAAHTILQADSIDRSAFDSLKALLSGINPKVDKALAAAGKGFKHLDQLQKGDIIELTLEAWPDVTPEDKKRKKAFLLFFKFWNDLKSEVTRVQKELDKSQKSGQGSVGAWGNILGAAKGPLGIITLVAAGVVMLKVTEVSVTIKNIGCDTLTPPSMSVPGLKLPGSIPTGGEAVAKIPPLSFTVDATNRNIARVTILGIGYNFPAGSVRATFDGQELTGAKTDINLGSQKDHTLTIQCK